VTLAVSSVTLTASARKTKRGILYNSKASYATEGGDEHTKGVVQRKKI